MLDGVVVSALDFQLRVEVQISARPEIWVEIFGPCAPPINFSFKKYTDNTLLVGRWDGKVEDWSSTLICWS